MPKKQSCAEGENRERCEILENQPAMDLYQKYLRRFALPAYDEKATLAADGKAIGKLLSVAQGGGRADDGILPEQNCFEQVAVAAGEGGVIAI